MITAKEIAKLVGGRIIGDENSVVTHACSIKESTEKSVSFVACSKYFDLVPDSFSSVIIIPESNKVISSNATLIVVKDPLLSFSKVLKKLIEKNNDLEKGIDKSAFIHKSATIGQNVYIGPNVIIEKGVTVGDGSIIHAQSIIGQNSKIGMNCYFHPNVTIQGNITVGSNVIIHSGAVLGSDGFGFVFNKGVHVKVPQIGKIEVGDNVEIGANTTIDRATVGTTKIGCGTKIDNLVQIAHNVEIGDNCLICAQVGIAGSTVIGNYVTLAGQAGIVGHIQIGDKAIVAAQAGVTKNVAAGEIVSGYPASPHSEARKVYSLLRKLPEIYKKMLSLDKKVNKKIASGKQDGKENIHA